MTTNLIVRPITDWNAIHLSEGSHSQSGDVDSLPPEYCGEELLSWVAGEPWSDQPECVSPVLSAFFRGLQDALPDDTRQRLATPEMLLGQLGTAGDGLDEARRYMAVDWAVRVATPMWLDAAGRPEFAAELRGLAPITDATGQDVVWPRLREIRDACWVARREALAKVRSVAAAADAIAAAVTAADAVTVAIAAADATAAADSATVAAAAATTVADAAADVVAIAAAAAVAAATTVADADATAATRDASWHATYNRVYRETEQHLLAQYAPVIEQVHASAIEIFARMINPGE